MRQKNIEVSVNVDVRKLDSKKLVETICNQIPRMFTKTNIQLNFSHVPELDPKSIEELKILLRAHKIPKSLGKFTDSTSNEEKILHQPREEPIQMGRGQAQVIDRRVQDLREIIQNIPQMPRREGNDNLEMIRSPDDEDSSENTFSDDDDESFDFDDMSFDDRFEDIDEDLS